jgi:hypothetical protein
VRGPPRGGRTRIRSDEGYQITQITSLECSYAAASTYVEPYAGEFQLTRGVDLMTGQLLRIVVEAKTARARSANRPIAMRVTGVHRYEFRLPPKLTYCSTAAHA